MKTRLINSARVLVATLSVIMCGLPATVAANQSPVSCNSNNLDLTLSKNKTAVRQGEVITYSVSVRNEDNGSSLACDITDATTTITLPAADGTATGTVVTIATSQDYPAGTPSTSLGTATYTVAVNPNVTDVIAKADINGTLHDAPVNHTAQITKTVGTSVTQPHLTLTKSADRTTAPINSPVTFTYVLTNDGTANANVSSVSLTDDQCSSVALASGDSNSNNVLDMGEAWTFTCTKTFTTVGTFTGTASASATDVTDTRAVASNQAVLGISVSGLPGLPNTGSGSDIALDPSNWWLLPMVLSAAYALKFA